MTSTQDPPRAPESHYGVRRCSGCASDFGGRSVVGGRASRFRRYEDRLEIDAHDVGWSRVGDGGLGGGSAGRAGRRERGRLGGPGADGVTVDCTGGNESFVTFAIQAAKNSKGPSCAQ